ncbi:hypothetical protein XENTR_v10006059 [Xenopus tropicalis]|nr:hypothetical protein XENTR_v10006059 [Xenopus tropicalis]
MSTDDSGSTSKVCFYIGANTSEDEDEEESEKDCKSLSPSYIQFEAYFWNELSRCEEGHDLPLEVAVQILRILRGLESSQGTKERLVKCNTFMVGRSAANPHFLFLSAVSQKKW